jgi:hypothetical protein
MSDKTKAILAELESVGLIRRTGRYLRNPKTGELEPTYTRVSDQRLTAPEIDELIRAKAKPAH